MRNIEVVKYNSFGAPDGELSGATSFTVDSLTSTLYALTSNGEIFFKPSTALEFCKIMDLGGEDWIDIAYVADNEALCCASSSGQLLSVTVDTEGEGEPVCEMNEMGSMEEVGGIAAMAWSPGEEVLAILTRSNVFLTISPDADVLVGCFCHILCTS